MSDRKGSPLLTPSRMRVYRECPQKHHLMYHLGYRAVALPEALRFGTLWHDVAAAGFMAVRALPPFDARGYELFRVAATEAIPGGSDPYEVAKVKAMLVAYVRAMEESNFLATHEILAVEEEFLFRHINPATMRASPIWHRAGKVDLLLRHLSGRVRVGEHKTTDDAIEPDALYWQRLALDTQVSQYVLGAEAMNTGVTVDEVVYDVVRKPALRPLKATPEDQRKYTQPTKANPVPRLYANQRESDETPEEYGARVESALLADLRGSVRFQVIPRTEDQIVEHLRETWSIAQMMREDANNGWAPKNPDACHRFGSCPFWLVCTKQVSIEDRSRYERLENVHPELNLDKLREVWLKKGEVGTATAEAAEVVK